MVHAEIAGRGRANTPVIISPGQLIHPAAATVTAMFSYMMNLKPFRDRLSTTKMTEISKITERVGLFRSSFKNPRLILEFPFSR